MQQQQYARACPKFAESQRLGPASGTLLNLGKLYLAMGRPAEAMPVLRRALRRSDPAEPITRAFCRLMLHCQRLLGQANEALTLCSTYRARYPLDAGLRAQEGELREEAGDLVGAEACYLQLMRGMEPDALTGISAPLLGFWARQQLARLYAKQGRSAEADALWPAVGS